MTHILFNSAGSVCELIHEENDLNLIRGDVAHMKSQGLYQDVSDEDYKSLVCGEKEAKLVDGNISITDTGNDGSLTEDQFTNYKNILLNAINEFLQNKADRLNMADFSSLKAKIETFKTELEAVDVSAITFPITSNFYRYWYDNKTSEPIHISFFT